MPLITTSTYEPRFPLVNRHLNTVFPSLFRKVPVEYERQRIDTPEDDFLDLDLCKVGSRVGVILMHGLEGSSESIYIKDMVVAVNREGWDAIAVNLRGCSGEPNQKPRAYHSGVSNDLHTVLEYVAEHYDYDTLFIVGFSLGGNVTLKYVGENHDRLHPLVRSAVGISVPVVLADTTHHLTKMFNQVYLQNFLYSLREKTRVKMEMFPDAPFDWEQLLKARNFDEFDNLYTAPAHGFKDAEDYYEKCSSRQFLPAIRIRIPTLLINALDDPFLPESCHPFEEAEASKHFYYEAPPKGGHVGFVTNIGEVGESWLERRVMDFLREVIEFSF